MDELEMMGRIRDGFRAGGLIPALDLMDAVEVRIKELETAEKQTGDKLKRARATRDAIYWARFRNQSHRLTPSRHDCESIVKMHELWEREVNILEASPAATTGIETAETPPDDQHGFLLNRIHQLESHAVKADKRIKGLESILERLDGSIEFLRRRELAAVDKFDLVAQEIKGAKEAARGTWAACLRRATRLENRVVALESCVLVQNSERDARESYEAEQREREG